MSTVSFLGLFAIIPTVLLVALSFFIAFTLTKVEKSVLRIFGMVTVGLLWISALIVFSCGILLVAEGSDYFGYRAMSRSCKCPCSSMMNQGCGMMNQGCGMMNQGCGMMNPNQSMTAPNQSMISAQSPGMQQKVILNTLRPDLMNKDMMGDWSKNKKPQ